MAKSKPNKSEPVAGNSRRDKLASLEAARKSEQRRRTVILLSTCLVLAALLLAYPVYLFAQDARMRSASIAELGLSPAAAACQPVQENPATGNQQHVADGTKVNYDRLPPDSGAHLNHWAPFAKKFYTAEERPVVEELVHNLEHGYTIAWYNPDMPKDQLKDLEWIAKTFNGGDYVKDKFIAAPWTPADGKAFPAGQNIILTHWYANPQDPGNAATQKGVRMGCGGVSGQAIKDFMAKYPSTSAPEPQGG